MNRLNSDNYNPYLSAERQMAELFDDHRPSPTPSSNQRPINNQLTPNETETETASMEQLEQDLKSILSEISQLGQTSAKERENQWQTTKKTMATQPSTDATSHQMNSRPKFCHQCGAAYPDRLAAKFCCQCGAKRLYLWIEEVGRREMRKWTLCVTLWCTFCYELFGDFVWNDGDIFQFFCCFGFHNTQSAIQFVFLITSHL